MKSRRKPRRRADGRKPSGRADGGRLAGVDGRADLVTAPTWDGPGQYAGGRLFQLPARGLLGLVMPTAQRGEVALTGQAAALERRGVVEVALAGGTAAAGEGAGLLPDPDQVLQRRRWPVGRGLPLVSTPSGLEPLHNDARQPGGRSGIMIGWGGTVRRGFALVRWSSWAARRSSRVARRLCWVMRWLCWVMRGWCWTGRGGRRAVPRPGAAVGDRAPVLAGQRYAPAGLWVAGHCRAKVTAVVGGQRAEPGYLARRVPQAEPRSQWNGQVDRARNSRDPGPASTRRGPGAAAARRGTRPASGRCDPG